MWVRVRLVLPFIALAACGGENLTLPGPGVPATLEIVSGDEQSAPVGEPLTQPLVVELLDATGGPVPNATVSFRFTDDQPDALIDPTTRPTDASGQASASARLAAGWASSRSRRSWQPPARTCRCGSG